MNSLLLFVFVLIAFFANLSSSSGALDPDLIGTWSAGGNTVTFTNTGTFSGILSGLQCSGTYLVDITKGPRWLDLVVNLPFPLRIEALYLHDVTGPGDRQLILQLPLNINIFLGVGTRPLSITAGAFIFGRIGIVAALGDSWLLGRFCSNDGLSVITFFENGAFELHLRDLILTGNFVVDLTRAPYWLDLHCLLPGGIKFIIPAIYQHSLVNGVKNLVLELPPFDLICGCVPLGCILSRPVAFLTRTVLALLDILLRDEVQQQQNLLELPAASSSEQNKERTLQYVH